MDSSAVQISVTTEPEQVRVKVTGTIDEHFNLAGHLPVICAAKRVVIDTGGVKRVNSAGVRTWIMFLSQLPPGVELVFEKLPVVLVEQANMVLNFLGHGRVTSFMAPYFCYDCQENTTPLIPDGKVEFDWANPHPPTINCATCSGALSFDDDEEGYFEFLKSGKSGGPSRS